MDRLIVITGLSGSGKSLAARCFEDLDYFCVDNLPVLLIDPFYELIERSAGTIHCAALVIDVRGRQFLTQFPEVLHELRARGAPVKLLFFECTDEVLQRRFSETRRPHPMVRPSETLEQGIHREREALAPLRDLADRIIDTSEFTAHQLRAFLKSSFGPDAAGGLNVNIISFGFKYGVPSEADLVFDVRFLPNPFFVERLRSLDGTNPEVRRFLDDDESKREFMRHLNGLLDFLVPRYADEGKSYLTVTLGCTGGKHRSVALAEELGEDLARRGIAAAVNHRDVGRE